MVKAVECNLLLIKRLVDVHRDFSLWLSAMGAPSPPPLPPTRPCSGFLFVYLSLRGQTHHPSHFLLSRLPFMNVLLAINIFKRSFGLRGEQGKVWMEEAMEWKLN